MGKGQQQRKGIGRRLIESLRSLMRSKAASEPAAAAEPAPEPVAVPTFSLDHLARRLYHADDPAAALCDFVANVERRIAAGNAVAPLEAFLAHALADAGVGETDVELPSLSIVRPRASGLFSVRVNELSVAYLALLRVWGIGAALNAAYFVSSYFGSAGPATEAEAWQFAHRVSSSIISQITEREADGPALDEHDRDGEWSVRKSIALSIESFQLPFRLNARFRVNVAAGEVAFTCNLAPRRIMWKRTSLDGVHVVPTTSDMQRRAATDYNARLAILLAACAFKASPRIERVWVAGTRDTAHHHSCLYSVCFDRERFSELDLAGIKNPLAILRAFEAALDEKDGVLAPVQQTFSLDDERFCPSRRFEAPEVSARILPEHLAHALGASSVAGLAIDEKVRREAIAREISRKLGSSTAENVATILDAAGDDPDPSVRAAAERTVRKLIEGSIAEDVFDITREFTEGDTLSAAVNQARLLFGAREIEAAESLLSATLGPLASVYADSASVVYRVFASYVDRVIYNRLGLDAGRTTLLAPEAYLEALLMHALSLNMLGRHDEAIEVARRAKELCPVGAQAQLALTQCLEASGRMLEAVDELRNLLLLAHDTVGIGFGYYRMAYFQWQLGETACAQACYLRALRFMPSAITLVSPELQIMALQGADRLEDISDEAVDELLAKHGIPLAPTREIGEIFFEGMRAALDAEIFPVARNFLITLGTMSRDDVFFGVLRSLEDEPDR